MRSKPKTSRDEYKITNIINYVRKSRRDEEREKRTGEDTLEEQKMLMCRVLDDLGIPYDQFLEIGSGDSIANRPVFQQVLQLLREGRYDTIAVKEISRLGRGSYEDTGLIMDLLQEKRIYIITPYRTYDPNNSSDARQIRFELFMAREEYEQIKERMVGARYSYAMQGKWMTGSVPFGYYLNSRTQRLEIDEDQAKVVRLIFDLYVNGIENKKVGFKAISNYLSKLSIKTPRGHDTWDTHQLKRMVTNPVYIGHVRFSQTERRKGRIIPRPKDEHIYVEEAHDSIIDMEIFYEAQKRISNPRMTPSHNGKGFQISELTALMVCNVCEKKLVINRSKRRHQKKDGEVSVYFDYYLRCRNGCLTTRYEPIEQKVVGLLEYFHEIDNNTLEKALHGLIQRKSKNDLVQTQRKEDVLNQIKSKVKELEKRRDFIFTKYENGIYDDKTFLERRAAIETELQELKTMEDGLYRNVEETASTNETPLDIELVKDNFTKILTIYKNTSNPQIKNEILHSLFHDITLTILEKGTVKRPAKVKLSPRFKHMITEKLNIKNTIEKA
jgi:DNA invertase Pin-like site-specific DNA recombinase